MATTEATQPTQQAPQTEIVTPERTELTKREAALISERKAMEIGQAGFRMNLYELEFLAKMIYRSGLAPDSINKSWEQIAVAIGFLNDLGLPIFTGLQNVAVINGRASLWGDFVLALCQRSPQFDHIAFDEAISAEEATCTVRRNVEGAKPKVRTFTLEDAKAAKLFPGRDRNGNISDRSPWNTYTKRMLQMRARMWALRDTFPELLKGLQSVEELRDERPAVEIIEGNRPERLPGETKSEHLANVMESRVSDKAGDQGTAGVAQPAITKAADVQQPASSTTPAPAEEPKKTTPRKPPVPKAAAKSEATAPAPAAQHSPDYAMFRDVIDGISRGEMSLDDYNALIVDNLPYAAEHNQLTAAEATELKGLAAHLWEQHANPQPKTDLAPKAAGGPKQGSLV
jgi:hypothetical protein